MLLLVEDNDEDYVAFVRALQGAGVSHPVDRCKTGDEALRYLRARVGANPPASLPALILLDLNLPGTDGRAVLGEIKRDESLKAIPIVVITTSSNTRDVEACYRDGANSYMVKSIQFDRFQRDVRLMADYWLKASLLPATADEDSEPC